MDWKKNVIGLYMYWNNRIIGWLSKAIYHPIISKSFKFTMNVVHGFYTKATYWVYKVCATCFSKGHVGCNDIMRYCGFLFMVQFTDHLSKIMIWTVQYGQVKILRCSLKFMSNHCWFSNELLFYTGKTTKWIKI